MNILLLDGGKDFGHSHGELNHTLHKKAKEILTALGHNVKETVIDAGYDVEAEIEKFFITVTAVIASIRQKATAQVACCKAKSTCFHLLGMPRLRRLPAKATSLKAKAWMLYICISTNSMSSSA